MNGPSLKGKGVLGVGIPFPWRSLGLELRPDTGGFVQTDSCCVPVDVLTGPRCSWHKRHWRGLLLRRYSPEGQKYTLTELGVFT